MTTPAIQALMDAVEAAQAVLAAAQKALAEALAAPPVVAQVLPTTIKLNPSALILFADYQRDEQAYDREDSLLQADGKTLAVTIRGTSAAGSDRVLTGTRYRLLLNGVERATVDVKPGTKRATFAVDLTPLSEGWYRMNVDGGTAETCVPWSFFRFTGPTGSPQTVMLATESSHALSNMYKYAQIHTADLPATFNPTIVPLVPRETPAFSDSKTTRTTLVQTQLAIWREANLTRTRQTRGVLHPFNQEPYYWATVAANRYPAAGGLDGPRGRGAIAMCTHLQPGRVDQFGGFSTYFCDPWRWGKITADGTVITLAGYRLKDDAPRLKAPYTDEQIRETLVLVGDWSAIKDPARLGLHEPWGFGWDERTLITDSNAKPIPNNGKLESPHLTGPVAFVADAQMGRILRMESSPISHDVPVKVTEFVTGLAEPWDCVCSEGVLYVSERKAHRIAAYDATSGAFLRVVLAGDSSAPGLAYLDQSRFVRRTGTIAAIRAQPCVLPEGLFLQDGWLYYGSIAMGQVRRVNLKTGEISICVPDIKEYSAGGTNFCKIAVSDGTFGPRGTVFFVTWSIANQGRPRAFLPDGVTEWPWAGVGAGASGPGQPWETMGYGSAVGVGNGKLLAGYSAEGITMHSKALPTDMTLKDPANPRSPSNDYWRLKVVPAYENAGLCLSHGPGGYGYVGLPLPWGISAEIDTYLKAYGHTPPAIA